MSTTPTPLPAASTTIAKDITWIRTHAIIAFLAVALIGGSIIGGVDLFEGMSERHDARVAAADQAREQVDTATQEALVTQLAQYRTADASRDAAQTALISSLVSQMNQQRAATGRQVAVDSALDAQSAAARLVTQTKASPTDVTVGAAGITMTLPLTRTVVADLDLYAQSQSDVTNLQGQLGAQQTLTTDAKTELGTADQIIAADKVELISTIKADVAACDVRVGQQAAKDRKRGFWATLAGFAGGIVLGGRLF